MAVSIYKLKDCSIVHLIASNPFVRFYYSILCKILRKKLIITYTDNIGEFPNSFYNLINNQSIRLATIPAVLNIGSFNIGQKINSKTRLISSFIPPNIDNVDLKALREYLGSFLSEHKFIFCTNAFNYCIDKAGNEMYGVVSLISIFNTTPDYGLIISDPSGAYNDYIVRNKISLGSNIKLLIATKFSFVNVIRVSHCFIRATTTDGDSLSIREALYLSKDVICSDCVSRPSGCILYPTNDYSSLFNIITNYKLSIKDTKLSITPNGYTKVLQIYDELMFHPFNFKRTKTNH